MDERPSSKAPPLNYVLFVVLAFGLLLVYPMVLERFFPRKPVVQVKKEDVKLVDKNADKDGKVPADAAKGSGAAVAGAPKAADAAVAKSNDSSAKPVTQAEKEGDEKHPDAKAADNKGGDKGKPPAMAAAPPPTFPPQWITLGSADPKSPYRMLVTLGNRGASLVRVELSSERYRDFEDRTGYLGHLIIDAPGKFSGCQVQVVGDGTPAAEAGLLPGDRIDKIGDFKILNMAGYEALLEKTKSGDSIQVTILRDGKTLTKTIVLTRRPLEVVSPEDKFPPVFHTKSRSIPPLDLSKASPLSLLMTLQQIDKESIPATDETKDSKEIDINHELSTELPGVSLRDANWELVRHNQESAEFRAVVRSKGADAHDILEIRKIFQLAKTTEATSRDADGRFYHLEVSLVLKNIDQSKTPHDVAYRLDGTSGLPHEGSWYANKLAVKSGCLRDVVYKMTRTEMAMTTCTQLADKPLQTIVDGTQISDENRPAYFGVDGQYFSTALLLQPDTTAMNIDRAVAIRVGDVDPDRKILTNTSFRIISKPMSLAPGQTATQKFELFAGPKRPNLLDQYALGELIYYGWFYHVVWLMTSILNLFYWFFHNYGVAIICLTVVVRLCMFPLSRAQAKNMQLMQQMQPDMKRITEKYKTDMEGRNKAMEELYRKHNTNQFAQLAGCLVMFLQLPIFLGLYRSLQINVDLRDAPLISESVRWCSNLAAPDMLFDWSRHMPDWFNSGIGSVFALGPYLNILPFVTFGLFILQQKFTMPPPADEQAAATQKMMNFMMIFMAVMFYRVASGLCLYFVATTLWGLAERQLLPKKTNPDDQTQQLSPQSPFSRTPRDGNNGDDLARRKKKRKR